MNLEVDVMEGDRFTVDDNGIVWQYRNDKGRDISFRVMSDWLKEDGERETTLDLPTFTRYCEGCGLTVKHIKPEPQVETIKPPEFAIIWPNGAVNLCKDLETAERQIMNRGTDPRIVRIDWGAK